MRTPSPPARLDGTSRHRRRTPRGLSSSERDELVELRRELRVTNTIVDIHRMSRLSYGSSRVHAELRLGEDIRCSRKRVERLMRQAGVAGIYRRKGRGCTRRDGSEPSDDLVGRAFGRRLRGAGLLGSMGSIGDCFDNSVAEGFFGTLTPRPTRPLKRGKLMFGCASAQVAKTGLEER